jgi:hypothetical protein
MVYGYRTNEEFIDKTQILLDKLEKKGVWDKDTLVVGLDKSVRPLAYTIRKLSKEEGRETPDIRFFNYSSYNDKKSKSNINLYSSYLRKKVNPDKLPKYKDIIILDEYIYSGNTMRDSEKILKSYFSKSKDKPKIHFAVLKKGESLISELDHPADLVYAEKDAQSDRLNYIDTGIADDTDTYRRFLRKKKITITRAPERYGLFGYSAFRIGRRRLSKDINEYLEERNGEESSSVGKSLEKAVQMVSVISFFGGVLLSYKGITGNVIGSVNSVDILGFVLIVLGILGLFVFRKVKK